MVATDSMSRPSGFLTNWEYRACATGWSVTFVCKLPARSGSLHWSSSYTGRHCSLSISSVSLVVFACLPTLSIIAPTVTPARRYTYCASLKTSSLLKFQQTPLHIWCLDFRKEFCKCAFARAATSEYHPPFLFTSPSVLHPT